MIISMRLCDKRSNLSRLPSTQKQLEHFQPPNCNSLQEKQALRMNESI